MKQIITLFLFAALGFNSAGQHLIGASARGWKGEAIYGLDYAYRWKTNRLGISLFYLENQYDYSNDIGNGAYLGTPYRASFDESTEKFTSHFVGRGASINYCVDVWSSGYREQLLIGWMISGSYLQIEDEYYFDYQQEWPYSNQYYEYSDEFQWSALSCMTGVTLCYRLTDNLSVDCRVGVNYYYPVFNRDMRQFGHEIYTSDAQYVATEFETGVGVNFWVGRE